MPSVDEIAWLRDNSPAWRLLRADNAPLVSSFLPPVFVADNVRSISAAELASRLDDELYVLNQQDGGRATPRFPKPAKAYLDDWAAPGAGLLADDLTVAASQADLRDPDFLFTLFTLPLAHPLLDTSQPMGVLLVAVLHFLSDSDDPWALVERIKRKLAPGSYLVMSHVTGMRCRPSRLARRPRCTRAPRRRG